MSDPSEPQRLLEELQRIRTQAEEHLKAAESARQKADSEALFAFNAKGACESHSTTIAGLKGTVEADVNTIITNKQKSDELLAAVNAAKATIDADIKIISERRKEIEQASQEIITAAQSGTVRLKEIDNSKTAAEASLKLTSEALNTATQARTSAEAAQKDVETFSAKAKELTANVTESHETSTQRATEIQKLLTSAQANQADLAKIVEHLTKSDVIAGGYEARLETLIGEVESLTKQVEELLPGATSTGLASSFNSQKARFAAPQRRWLWMFVLCIGGLVIVALPSFLSALGINLLGHTPEPTWDAALRGLTMRLPIAIPLVWLAIYAGRNYMLSLRLEEDYAYKEAISTAFEGYKRQMEKIVGGDAASPTPITTLCVNVLRAIAERPGRIYEGQHQDITLLTEMKEMIEKAEEFRKKTISAS